MALPPSPQGGQNGPTPWPTERTAWPYPWPTGRTAWPYPPAHREDSMALPPGPQGGQHGPTPGPQGGQHGPTPWPTGKTAWPYPWPTGRTACPYPLAHREDSMALPPRPTQTVYETPHTSVNYHSPSQNRRVQLSYQPTCRCDHSGVTIAAKPLTHTHAHTHARTEPVAPHLDATH